MTDYQTLLRRCAAIAGFGAREADTIHVPKDEWGALGGMVTSRRLTGLAVAAWEAGALVLASEADTDDLLARHRDLMMHALRLETCLRRVVAGLEREGISPIVLKGPALAHTRYPDPSWRPFGDLDLMVRTSDWRRACAVLEQLSFHRDLPEPARGFDERFGKAATHTSPEGVQLDLHRTLVLGPFGLWIDPEQLVEHTTTFRVGGRDYRCLDDSALVLHVCVHAVLGSAPPMPLPLRDVVQAVGAPEIDWGQLEVWGKKWHMDAVLKEALSTAERQLSVTLPPATSSLLAGRPGRHERRAFRSYQTGRRSAGGIELSTIMAIKGIRARADYLRSLAFPSHDFLIARAAGGRASRLRRLAIPFRWLAKRHA
jgi:Uncharacterised nucleotidyltransferase